MLNHTLCHVGDHITEPPGVQLQVVRAPHDEITFAVKAADSIFVRLVKPKLEKSPPGHHPFSPRSEAVGLQPSCGHGECVIRLSRPLGQAPNQVGKICSVCSGPVSTRGRELLSTALSTAFVDNDGTATNTIRQEDVV